MKTLTQETKDKISNSLKGRGHQFIKKICDHCNSEFEVSWRKRNQRFCSKSCRAKSIVFSNQSIQKMSVAKSGENNPMFGISPKNTKRLKVHSVKHIGNKTFFVRSSYEKEYVEEITANERVISFEYEPASFKCNYLLANKNRTYQPDFLITEIDRTYIVEIKAKWQKDSAETLIKEKAFKDTYSIEYKILTKHAERVYTETDQPSGISTLPGRGARLTISQSAPTKEEKPSVVASRECTPATLYTVLWCNW